MLKEYYINLKNTLTGETTKTPWNFSSYKDATKWVEKWRALGEPFDAEIVEEIVPTKEVITELKDDYVLVKWTKSAHTEWVVAYGYNDYSGSWAQGHYFYTFKDAVEYARVKEIL